MKSDSVYFSVNNGKNIHNFLKGLKSSGYLSDKQYGKVTSIAWSLENT